MTTNDERRAAVERHLALCCWNRGANVDQGTEPDGRTWMTWESCGSETCPECGPRGAPAGDLIGWITLGPLDPNALDDPEFNPPRSAIHVPAASRDAPAVDLAAARARRRPPRE